MTFLPCAKNVEKCRKYFRHFLTIFDVFCPGPFPSFLGLSPDPGVTEQKSYGVYFFPGKTREKGIHHRSGKKGIHHEASDPEKKKEGFHGGGVYFLLPCASFAGKNRELTDSGKTQGRKTKPNPNFLVRISSGGVGVFHVKGWGPKSSVCPSKHRETKLFGWISRDFARDILGVPEKFEKKKFVFNSRT